MASRSRSEEADVEHERMRIAMVVAAQVPGVHVHVSGLAAALAGSGHDVTIYTRRSDPRPPTRESTDHGYEVVRVPAGPAQRIDEEGLVPHLGRFADHLRREWRHDPPDVAHAHHWTSGLASILAAQHGMPVVQTYHGLGVVERGCGAKRLPGERIVGREATRVIATSSEEVVTLVRMGVARSHISVVPTGVDLRMFTPFGTNAERGGQRRIITAGELMPHRGFADAVLALSRVDETELLIVGGPKKRRINYEPEVRRLRELAGRVGVADRVAFTGGVPREEMPSLLRSADAVVCTPWYDPAGLASLEAMACGVPVVATAVGGLIDTIVDGVTGLHVQPVQPRRLAKLLRGLLADGTRRQEFGIAGYDRTCARYSWERIAADTVRVYQGAGGEDCRPNACGRRRRVSGVPTSATPAWLSRDRRRR
ncbi:glycosyltransferase [Lentzea sp. NPDC005914]|uniref:glycosyltransferase n=1 Tax=Lentzea sp. NPDC005914 TaxID=3154572 RepID=UPI0033DDF5BC